MSPKIVVFGLGYVGLPVAVAFAEKFPGTFGFDPDHHRVASLRNGGDSTGQTDSARLKRSSLKIVSDVAEIRDRDTFIVCVPTPVHSDRSPDLALLRDASESIGRLMRPGALVVYESTVYPGVIEGFCAPILERISGLKSGRDFNLCYSPERINPGDDNHNFERTLKVVAGQNDDAAMAVAELYGTVVSAGVYVAPSIKVAEAAKLLENAQRDINIALMNEVSVVYGRMDISMRDVLETARTKWNFADFTPGLVGGHCVAVDPYYLISKARDLGYEPQILLASRQMNASMAKVLAERILPLLTAGGCGIANARVGVLGLTFKENVADTRNSGVFDLLRELVDCGVNPIIHDPLAQTGDVRDGLDVTVTELEHFGGLDALILAVPHRAYLDEPQALFKMLRDGGILIDVKGAIGPKNVPSRIRYWSL